MSSVSGFGCDGRIRTVGEASPGVARPCGRPPVAYPRTNRAGDGDDGEKPQSPEHATDLKMQRTDDDLRSDEVCAGAEGGHACHIGDDGHGHRHCDQREPARDRRQHQAAERRGEHQHDEHEPKTGAFLDNVERRSGKGAARSRPAGWGSPRRTARRLYFRVTVTTADPNQVCDGQVLCLNVVSPPTAALATIGGVLTRAPAGTTAQGFVAFASDSGKFSQGLDTFEWTITATPTTTTLWPPPALAAPVLDGEIVIRNAQ